ncbi:MAG: hypothetical protein J2P54_01090 [Bradyrhizobiaceae bacterium]|nr:hypothetical protein [Bradyrhizobiaceae bacterium]MBO0754428.1 hypothetical protein [Bradyrhizobiaceae bacterium]
MKRHYQAQPRRAGDESAAGGSKTQAEDYCLRSPDGGNDMADRLLTGWSPASVMVAH